MVISIKWCVAHNDIGSWPISSRSFSHGIAIKLLKYVTSGCVCSTTHTVLRGLFPYLSQIITSMRGCVMCKDIWPWPISSRTCSHDVPRDQCPGYDFSKMSAVNSKLHQQNCKCRHGSWCSLFCNEGLTSSVSILVNSLQWRHNGRDSVSNHQPHDCFLNRLFRRGSRKTSKLCVTGLYAGNSPGTGEFPA